MTIQSRLLIAFSILVSIVVIMAGVLVIFGFQNRRLSEESLITYSRLYILKEVSQSFESQWKNLNYYVVLSDEKEMENFSQKFELINKHVKSLANSSPKFTAWYDGYVSLNELVENSIKSGSREKLFEIYSNDLTPRSQSLRNTLSDQIEYRSGLLDDLEKRIKHLNRIIVVFSIVFAVLAIMIGGLMSIVIFRSISRPLSLLQEGARMIGEGKLDYQIPVTSQDEIGKLAQSFNKMVNDLRNMQLQIIQMDRMSSIGQLAGGVAHEINNPLTGVLGQAQLLLEKLSADHPCRKAVERIESAAQRCRRIVRALLDFAREKNYNFNACDVDKMLEETLDFTKTEMDSKNISLIKNVDAGLPPVRASFGHIQQVFLNIVTNAIQAIPKGGTISVGAMQKDGMIEIRFKDNGMGIKKENLNHVFDPFFTTKDIGQGTGLGLTISYGIIQRHQGDIIAESEGEGKGAAFVIRLPVNASYHG